MDANDFRRIALSLAGVEESSHMGQSDFELEEESLQRHVAELPEIFLPIADGWGRMGMTHIRLPRPAKTY